MIITPLITIEEFVGVLRIAKDKHADDDFKAIVKKEQDELFRDLITGELYRELVTDVNASNPTIGEPSKQKFIDLLNGVDFIDDDDNTVVVVGALEAIRHFVYSQSVQQQPYKNTPSGTVISQNENSQPIIRQQLNVQTNQRYNKGVELYEELVQFVKFYTKFKTTYTSISEAPAGTYTVLISDTQYLSVGDTITIEGTEFLIDVSVTTDTSIVFTSTAGKTFAAGGNIFWEPFKDVSPQQLDPIYW